MTGRSVQVAPALLLPVLLLISAASVHSETEDSFRLTADFEALADYFPGYLANGYVSTLSTPRGTEAAPAYMVGLMDYTTGDMARPAAVPGWTEVDFSARASGSDSTWLNRVPLDTRRFRDYRQTLDLHDALLTTSYRYLDAERETAVEVTSLVSQASPHLAATRFTITPYYDGTVRLSFALMLWAPHAPRLPLAQLSGSDMEEAVAANGLSLTPRAPATPDRAALWYPGYTQVLTSDGDAAALSLRLDGRAEQGLPMAMAAAVALPEGVRAETVTVHRDHYRLALDVSLQVTRGQTYVFTKYIAQSRAGWGGDSADDLALVRQARERGFDRLLNEHRAAWDALWQTDIQIDGDAKAQQAIHSELYYLLASSTADTAWALGACGLTTGYAGHIFWDSDTWIFQALLLLHPERAKSLVAFRERTLDAARLRAQQHGFDGAMYPWEADPENGSEQTPHSAFILGESEIHVNADVAIAQWQYFLGTADRTWLHEHGWPVIRDVARFWASRASYDPRQHRYDIVHVNSVAESHTDIPDDTFTNVSAAKALRIATAAAQLVGERADPLWNRVAQGLYIPLDPEGQRHLPFDPSVSGDDEDFGGGVLSLLFLPSLDPVLTDSLRRNDYAVTIRGTSLARIGQVSMGIAPRSIAADTVGNNADAEASFATNLTGGTLKPPFNVRTETASNNVGYFLTGSGGFLQSIIFGFSGLRIRESGLEQAFPPVLPSSWHSLALRNLRYRGQRLDVYITRDSGGVVRSSRVLH